MAQKMDIETASQILFQKPYTQLTDSQAEEAHDFRDQWESMSIEQDYDDQEMDWM